MSFAAIVAWVQGVLASVATIVKYFQKTPAEKERERIRKSNKAKAKQIRERAHAIKQARKSRTSFIERLINRK